MNSYYYIGHFSRFVVPGARRIVSSSNDDRLLSTASINPDGTIIVVLMNQTDRDIEFKTWLEGKAVQSKSPAHSIITMLIRSQY
jgi:glucosylceramidase